VTEDAGVWRLDTKLWGDRGSLALAKEYDVGDFIELGLGLGQWAVDGANGNERGVFL